MSDDVFLEDVIADCKRALVAAGIFSFFVNALSLTPLFYMLNVYDKAVASGSFPTLISLAAIALLLYLVLLLMEWIRSLILIQIGLWIDGQVGSKLYEICFSVEAGTVNISKVGSQPMTDLASLRQFLASPTAMVFFDLPWVPLFMLLMVFFHPTLFVVALICIVTLVAIAILNQRLTTKGLSLNAHKQSLINEQTRRNLRNAEVAEVMGMVSPLTEVWRADQEDLLLTQNKTTSLAVGFSSTMKVLTMMMQSIAITTGATLAMAQEISPGVMIAAALLLGRSLQPLQMAVSGWRSIVDAIGQYKRLSGLLRQFPHQAEPMSLPKIVGNIAVERASVCPPGSNAAVIVDLDIAFPSGSTTLVLGPSGSGKSSLLKALLGLWPAVRGKIRIDGAEASQYSRELLGPQVGYLPQGIELFDGSVSDNIARFGDLDSEKVIQAAKDANVHDLILSLPSGYDTKIRTGSGAMNLTPGQLQRLALARTLYGRPKLLVLDEPNSNLDAAGEEALFSALHTMKNLGSTIVIVSHRQGLMPLADNIALMEGGKLKASGDKQTVLTLAKEKKRKAVPADESKLRAIVNKE